MVKTNKTKSKVKVLKTYGKPRSSSSTTSNNKQKPKTKAKVKSVITPSDDVDKKTIDNGIDHNEEENQNENQKLEMDNLIRKILCLVFENTKNVDWFDLTKKLNYPTLKNNGKAKKQIRGKKEDIVMMNGVELRDYFNDIILPRLKSNEFILPHKSVRSSSNDHLESPALSAQGSKLSKTEASEDTFQLDGEEESQLVLPVTKEDEKPKTKINRGRAGKKEVVIKIGDASDVTWPHLQITNLSD
ncbi:uncharacterized protein I206_103470 [Kwoniella pini CBS 10737]|uniref:Uncharacterized protein n=1 Tax=Kwoniella pini CBS 10737 TaxID=1296096 RepID=A0A1B9IA00_9TREE|nr:uncharacterized protein I206_01527 [Kwoniella pini CBS 10737]OCF52241.1 hypothetical protein I206_01527 [Kwoniella pini CBS 10737]